MTAAAAQNSAGASSAGTEGAATEARGAPGSADNNAAPAAPQAGSTQPTISGGFVTNTAAPSDPLLVTPSMTLVTPAPTAGASAAGRAGISNSSPNDTYIPPSGPMQGVRLDQNGAGASGNVNPAGVAIPGDVVMSDSGARGEFISSDGSGNAAATMSLGEVAARYRASRGQQPATGRVYTNEHISRMNAGNQSGSFEAPGAGTSTDAQSSGMQHPGMSTVNSDQGVLASGDPAGSADDRKADAKPAPEAPKPPR